MKPTFKSFFLENIGLTFLIKVFIIFSLCNILIFEIRYVLREFDLKPRVKIYLKGNISNPEALYIASFILEREKKIDEAIIDMELAVTLIDIHSNSEILRERYINRLTHLKSLKVSLTNIKN